eukprot:NODE_5131_length_425_cov_37.877660_g4461_i0.p2 GENE.NODE_5131_length_425_cov_37.877660_g4461_i0~~NODE_5131_length_425_cov_37.877660_g4461_i0.p2  ORF type:complete len:60 (-),score=2.79 NODE_5131_length_425_cov_37.877660_g4461_i0:126-305(-)
MGGMCAKDNAQTIVSKRYNIVGDTRDGYYRSQSTSTLGISPPPHAFSVGMDLSCLPGGV